MFHIERIGDLEHPDLAPYRTLKLPHEHRTRGIFVAEGDKVVHRLLASPIEIISVLLPEHRLAEYAPALEARRENITTYTVSDRRVIEALVGFEMFQGVLAIAKIPTAPTVASLLLQTTAPRLFVAADGLSNAENVGVLVRNCAAFRAQALFVGETSASPYLRRAVRNSMGTVFQLPIVPTESLRATLAELRAAGVTCLAAHPHTEQVFLPAANLRQDVCLVFGAEGHGISPEILAACDAAVAIPMPPGVDSLNVASAAAVFLYEAQRQRTGHAPH